MKHGPARSSHSPSSAIEGPPSKLPAGNRETPVPGQSRGPSAPSKKKFFGGTWSWFGGRVKGQARSAKEKSPCGFLPRIPLSKIHRLFRIGGPEDGRGEAAGRAHGHHVENAAGH